MITYIYFFAAAVILGSNVPRASSTSHDLRRLTYVGGLNDRNEKHGLGVLEHRGFVYVGAFQNGKKHGHGRLHYPSNAMYDGMWKNGKRVAGTMVYKSGSVYVGDFAGKKRHGQGKMVFSNSSMRAYEGSWVDGYMHGYGKIEYQNGDVFTGRLRLGKQYGRGTMKYYASGDVYKAIGLVAKSRVCVDTHHWKK